MESYTLLGKRKLESFAKLAVAQVAGEEAIKKITNGERQVLELRNRDRFEYMRAKELLSGLAVTLDAACAQYVEALKVLTGTGSILDACREFGIRKAVKLIKMRGV